RRLLLLYAGVIPTAVLVAVAAAGFPGTPHLAAVGWPKLALAVGATMAAQLARVRVRVGTSQISLGWGEAALVVVIFLIPFGWVPATVFVGVLAAQLILRLFGEVRTPVALAYNAAILSLAAAAASAIAALVNPRLHDLGDLRIAGALIPAAI